MTPDIFASGSDTALVGNSVEVGPTLEPTPETRYSISSDSQAVSVCEQLQGDAEQIIQNSSTIVSYLNGMRPFDTDRLAAAGKLHMANISTRFLRNQCAPVPSRLFMPVLTAQYLTAAELPAGWPRGAHKSQIFREEVTATIRAWPQWHWFNKHLAHECGVLGYGFATWFDEYEWRPTFIRQTRGFVPIGTQVADEAGPPLYAVAWDYRVDELLGLVRRARQAGLEHWKEDVVRAAIESAQPKAKDATESNAREYAEMVRDATIGETYEKGYRIIPTWHLFSGDPDGTVSHQIVLREGAPANPPRGKAAQSRLLFEKRRQFASMHDVVQPLVFDPETGTIHGSWGAAQHLFDLALEFERSFCDWINRLRVSGKVVVVTRDSGHVDEIKLAIHDEYIALAHGNYAGNVAAIPTDPKPSQALLESFAAAAREIIGNYIPPISMTPDDVKAAQVDAKVKEQQEKREQSLQMLLLQYARIIRSMVRRLTNPQTDDAAALALQAKLLARGMTPEEIGLLANEPPIRTIFSFTNYAQERQAAFLASKSGNPFYNQATVERKQCEAIGGREFAEAVLMPGDDATTERTARRLQALETSAMLQGEVIEVLPQDSDYSHLQELLPKIEQAIMDGHPQAQNLLAHATAHFVGAINKKGFPPGHSGNQEKQFIRNAQRAIETGQIPPGGLMGEPDAITLAEQQMSQQPVLVGPSQEPPLSANQSSNEGLDQIVRGNAA